MRFQQIKDEYPDSVVISIGDSQVDYIAAKKNKIIQIVIKSCCDNWCVWVNWN